MEIIKIDGELATCGLRSNSFLLVSGNFCCVIDPSFERSEVEKILQSKMGNNIEINAVILTHCHADHCVALNTYTNIRIYLTQATETGLFDEKINLAPQILGKELNLGDIKDNLKIIKDGDEIKLFPNYTFWIKSTPGHTLDSVCIYNDKDIFVGDLIFANGGIGRIDLPTGSAEKIRESLRWIKSLDANLRVHSGHNEDFILGEWDR